MLMKYKMCVYKFDRIRTYKRFVFLFVLVISFLTSCTSGEEDLLELEEIMNNLEKQDESNIEGSKISNYMNLVSADGYLQGADCYGDYLFQFVDHNASVMIHDLKEKEHVGKVVLSSKSQNHCNNVSFSRVFYDEKDEFPLLYVSGSRDKNHNQVQVYRIKKEASTFHVEQIQEIVLPKATSQNGLYWTGVVMDNSNNYMYIYANSDCAQIVKLQIPDVSQYDVILSEEDIISQFSLEKFTHQQGATIFLNKMYVLDGVPAWGDTNYLRIIDLEKQKNIAKINVTDMGLKAEPEGTFVYKNELFCAANNSRVFKISLK